MSEPTMRDIENTLSDRKKTHGDFYQDVAPTHQALLGVMRRHRKWDQLSASHQVALEMIGHKIARILSGNPDEEDHWRDCAGYAALGLKGCLSGSADVVKPMPRRADLDKLERDLRREQRRSWVRGEMMIENPEMTREEVDAILDKIEQEG